MRKNSHFENKYEYPSFLRSAFAIQGSVTPRVMKLVFFSVLYAAFVSLLHAYFLWVSVPISPFEYAGLIMGLILVFRINAGYDRWWEARKIWGDIVNTSRNFATLCIAYPKKTPKKEIKALVSYIIALPYLMKNHLRSNKSTHEIEDLLDKKTYQTLQNQSHKPNFISQKIAEALARLVASGELDHFAFLQAEKNRAALINSQGACERILKTPMPFVMAIKSRRFIFLFLLMLPIALAEYSLFLNLLVTMLVSYALLSLDQIGIELQNAFSNVSLSHLPLDTICQNIHSDLDELLENQ